jgi:hypothetical protein
MPSEDELLLPPNCEFVVESVFSPTADLHMVHLASLLQLAVIQEHD